MPRDPVSPNRQVLARAARELGELTRDLVFVGGKVAELLVTTSGLTRVRPTEDVDVVVSATTAARYGAVEEHLRRTGFRNDSREGAPICRWLSPSGIIVDLMPVDPSVLGFSNRWYPMAIETSEPFLLAEDLVIRIPQPAVFLATKWAAVEGRAGEDIMASHDMEDIIAVVAGRPSIIDDVAAAPAEVRGWLAEKAAEFLLHPDAEYALEGALPDSASLPGLIPLVRDRFIMMRDGGV